MTTKLSLLRNDWKSRLHGSSSAEQSNETEGRGVHYLGRTQLLKADWYRSHINAHRRTQRNTIAKLLAYDVTMSAGNSRAAYMREYRKGKRLDEDNLPKRKRYMPKDSVNMEKYIKT
jgi:hypothetical protein